MPAIVHGLRRATRYATEQWFASSRLAVILPLVWDAAVTPTRRRRRLSILLVRSAGSTPSNLPQFSNLSRRFSAQLRGEGNGTGRFTVIGSTNHHHAILSHRTSQRNAGFITPIKNRHNNTLSIHGVLFAADLFGVDIVDFQHAEVVAYAALELTDATLTKLGNLKNAICGSHKNKWKSLRTYL